MSEELIDLIESEFGYPVYLQGSMNDSDDYPPSFFTYWNFDSPDEDYFDNQAFSESWWYWIYFYTSSRKEVRETMKKLKSLLESNDYIVEGNGIDAKSDIVSHTGKMITVYKKIKK